MGTLVTGINGFIGKNIQFFLNNKHTLIKTSTTLNKDYVSVSKNFSDIDEKLNNKEFDSILHLAAVIPDNFEKSNFNDFFLPNAVIMENLFKLAAKRKIKKFIYLSGFGSMEDYKNYKIKDYYTLSKIHGEHVCSMMEAQGIQTASLRIPSPYGPYSKAKNVINMFLERALNNEDLNVHGSGRREQNFLYIEDVVRAIDLFLSTNNKLDGIYNIVSEKNTSVLELACIIKEKCDSKSKIIVGNTPDVQENFIPEYDYFRAFNTVGYKPKYTISSGLDKYIEWYVRNR